MTRFTRVVALLAVLAAVYVAGAYALAFADDAYIWPDGTVGEPYFKEMHTRSDCPPFKYDILAGSLPPGLTLESRGVVSGIPQQLGSWSFWMRLRDCQNQSAEREFTLKITHVRLIVTTTTLPVAIRNAAYSGAIATTGGAGTKSWTLTAGQLPAGLTLNADGTISGTPTANGDFVFTVKVADDGPSTDTKQLLIRVVDPLAITPLGARARIAEVSRPFNATLTGTGGTQPYTWSVTGTLPDGLTLDPTTGVMSGVPETAGSAPLTVTMTDANKLSQTLAVSFTVAGQLTIVTNRLASPVVGQAYSATLAVRGGFRPFRWRAIAGRLPRGIGLNARTGTLSGTASLPGSYRLRVQVTDLLGVKATKPLVLAVHA